MNENKMKGGEKVSTRKRIVGFLVTLFLLTVLTGCRLTLKLGSLAEIELNIPNSPFSLEINKGGKALASSDNRGLVASHFLKSPSELAPNFFLNIKLALAYACKEATKTYGAPGAINWGALEENYLIYQISLKPGQTFEFDKDLKCNFSDGQGFLSNGDGLCNFASLMYWTCQEAGLNCRAPTSHATVGNIPGVPKKYQIAIHTGHPDTQNLWVTNTSERTVMIQLIGDSDTIKVNCYQFA